jgi:hypothetical protein
MLGLGQQLRPLFLHLLTLLEPIPLTERNGYPKPNQYGCNQDSCSSQE